MASELEWNAHSVTALLTPPGSRVLDIGCGFGSVAKRLQAAGCEVIGIEPDPERRQQATAYCARVLDGTAEGLDQLGLDPASFDVILFTDVLEHLVDPWSTLTAVLRYLKPEGRVVISIPNVANFGARVNLLKGQFRYQQAGLYDRTHLRFFTRETLEEMVRGAGLRVVEWHYTTNLTDTRIVRGTVGRIKPLYSLVRRLDRWSTYRANRLLSLQFVIACEREA